MFVKFLSHLPLFVSYTHITIFCPVGHHRPFASVQTCIGSPRRLATVSVFAAGCVVCPCWPVPSLWPCLLEGRCLSFTHSDYSLPAGFIITGLSQHKVGRSSSLPEEDGTQEPRASLKKLNRSDLWSHSSSTSTCRPNAPNMLTNNLDFFSETPLPPPADSGTHSPPLTDFSLPPPTFPKSLRADCGSATWSGTRGLATTSSSAAWPQRWKRNSRLSFPPLVVRMAGSPGSGSISLPKECKKNQS